MIRPADVVRYRSLGVGEFDALVIVVRLDGRVDLEVENGSSKPTSLTRIRCAPDRGTAGRGECYPAA